MIKWRFERGSVLGVFKVVVSKCRASVQHVPLGRRSHYVETMWGRSVRDRAMQVWTWWCRSIIFSEKGWHVMKLLFTRNCCGYILRDKHKSVTRYHSVYPSDGFRMLVCCCSGAGTEPFFAKVL